MNSYQVCGLTHCVTATSTSSEITISPTQAGNSFSGQVGPLYFKITNGSAENNIFFKTGTTSQTAVIPVAGSPGTFGSTPVPAYAEVIVQVAPDNTVPPATIYVACVAASSSSVYITPVVIAGQVF